MFVLLLYMGMSIKIDQKVTGQAYTNSGHSKSEWMAIVDIFSERNVSFAID